MQAQLVWGDVDALPVLAASHFLMQTAVHDAPNVKDIILTVGYLAPPFIQGTPDQVQEIAVNMDQITVRPVARFSIPATKAADLAQLLGLVSQQVAEASNQR